MEAAWRRGDPVFVQHYSQLEEGGKECVRVMLFDGFHYY